MPDWPEAEFIVGNPPFIGGSRIREYLGGAYAEALWKTHRAMNDSADFVMYWWDRAADILLRKKTVLIRFGFVTTNSITQVFQRKTLERHLTAKKPLSLIYAIADHPWTKATKDSAAVRIAMAAARAGTHDGVLETVTAEHGLDQDNPHIAYDAAFGRINSDLTVGVDVTHARELQANRGLASEGMKPHGLGFILTRNEAEHLGVSDKEATKYIRPYLNGRDLTSRTRDVYAIDLFGLTDVEVRTKFPRIYQHLLFTVKPARESQFKLSGSKDAEAYAKMWWVFGKPRQEMRQSLSGLSRYLVTVKTAKHRVFQFVDNSVLPDSKLIAFSFDGGFELGVLSSWVHICWSFKTGGWLGFGNDSSYVKSISFDAFPFPDASEAQKAEIGEIAEALDAHRKRVLAEHPHLTLTGLYNVLERLKAGIKPDDLNADERRIFDDGLVLILKEYHDRLDAAVARAYGWDENLREDEILARLVALNKERALEEAAGRVKWLRPDYQIPRFAKVSKATTELDLGDVADVVAARPAFPKTRDDQPFAVLQVVEQHGLMSEDEVVRAFDNGGRYRQRILSVLKTLDTYGHINQTAEGRFIAARAA